MEEITENDVTLKCESGCLYTKYKKLAKRKILASIKCDCLFRLRGLFVECWCMDPCSWGQGTQS